MIKFSEIIDFRTKEKEIFEKFEQDLSAIAKINKQIKPAYSKVCFSKDAKQDTKYTVDFKGKTYTQSGQDMFWDLLLNGYNTIKSGKEFTFNQKDNKYEFEKLTLVTKEGKLAFLASLYTMLFDIQYVETVDENTLQRILVDNQILFFKINHSAPLGIMQTEIKIDNNATTKLDRRISVKTHRRYNYITAKKLVSEVNSYRKKIDKSIISDYEKERYEKLKELIKDKEIMPSSTHNKCVKVFNKPAVKDVVGNISNEFAIKATMKGLPEKLNETVYTKFISSITSNKENQKLTTDEMKFLTSLILLDKYTYEKMGNLQYASWASPQNLRNINFERNRYYKKVYQAPEEFLVPYFRKFFQEIDSMYAHEQLIMLFSMLVLYNQEEEKLKRIIEITQGSFQEFARKISPDNYNEINALYNVEDIKNKKLFKSLAKPLGGFLANKYNQMGIFAYKVPQDEKLSDLNNVLLEETVYKGMYYFGQNDQVQRNSDMEPILKDLAELFELKTEVSKG